MRLKAISLILATVLWLPVFANNFEPSKFLEGQCRAPGGEGPKPMIELPSFFSNIHPFPLDNSAADGFFLPKSNRFIYRDRANQFTVANFNTNAKTVLTRFETPIAKVKDPSERFFAPQGTNQVFDAAMHYWWDYRGAYSGKIRPLFWGKRQNLYSAVVSDDTRNANFRVQSYTVGAARAKRVCGGLNFALNSGYKLGEGHVYPNMVLHRTEPMGSTGRKLTVSLLNIENCTIETKTYADLMKGEVLNVYYYAQIRSVLIQTDHPTQQLVWDTGPDAEHCHYYSLNGSQLLILGYQYPIIGAYDPYDGLSIVYLHDEKNNPPRTAQVTGDYPLAHIASHDLELNPQKTALYGITQLIDKSKTLVKIDLPAYTYP